MRRRLYNSVINGTIRNSYQVGDIVCCDYENPLEPYCVFSQEKYEEIKYTTDRWQPYGVIVIPSNHDFYKTGEAAMMSCENVMEYYSGITDVGTFRQQVLVNESNVKMIPKTDFCTYLGSLKNMLIPSAEPVTTGRIDMNTGKAEYKMYTYSIENFIPYLIWEDNADSANPTYNVAQCAHDPKTVYMNNANLEWICPSPYDTDGYSYREEFISNIINSSNDVLSYNPYGYAENALAVTPSLGQIQRDFRPDTKGPYDDNEFSWHWPSLAEMIYVLCRIQVIDKSLLLTMYEDIGINEQSGNRNAENLLRYISVNRQYNLNVFTASLYSSKEFYILKRETEIITHKWQLMLLSDLSDDEPMDGRLFARVKDLPRYA